MRARSRESGAITARNVVEFFLIFLVAYIVVQVAPFVVLRLNFLNELEVLANSPVQNSAAEIRREVLATAEGYGITLVAEQLHVAREREQKKTVIDVEYQLFINFWPRFTYVWNVHDRVEGLLL